jgi:hypothetical protein
VGLALALLSLAPVLAGGARAADDSCRVPDAPRIVAVGDVHGSYDSLLAVLGFAGIVDAKGKWSGGKAHLVQTGDLLDRGKDARKVLDLLMRLEGDARKAGGRVHALLGNHEVMNLLGDLRYLNVEEYAAFRTPDSEAYREAFFKSAAERARAEARSSGAAFDEAAFRSKFLAEVPLGLVERTQALSAQGRYGKWLRQRPVVAKVNGVVFVHGGLTPEVAALGCAEVNARVRRELNEDVAKTKQAPLATLAAGENGPLWYRGLAKDDESILAPQVDQVLQSLGARAIVVGHSVTGTGKIVARFGGRVFGIDVGMGDVYGGNLAALEVGPDGTIAALYPGSREELARPAAAAARAEPGPCSRILANPGAGEPCALEPSQASRPNSSARRSRIQTLTAQASATGSFSIGRSGM